MTASPIAIVFDHHDFIVVNKPCDVSMHDPVLGICTILRQQLHIEEIYLIHRLDSATSGCLLLAKNKLAAARLSALFANKLVQKYYLAISDTKPKKKQGKIAGDMKKTRGGSYTLKPSESAAASAISFIISEPLPGIGRLFYVKPITGKTHQIRVSLKSIGSTILGDTRYKGSAADRLYLHSFALAFCYQGEDIYCQSYPQSGRYFQADVLASVRPVATLPWPAYKPPHCVVNRTREAYQGT